MTRFVPYVRKNLYDAVAAAAGSHVTVQTNIHQHQRFIRAASTTLSPVTLSSSKTPSSSGSGRRPASQCAGVVQT
jgi:hypothetical protein